MIKSLLAAIAKVKPHPLYIVIVSPLLKKAGEGVADSSIGRDIKYIVKDLAEHINGTHN